MAITTRFVCPVCGDNNGRGPLCGNCGESVIVSAAELAPLINRRLIGVGFLEIQESADHPLFPQSFRELLAEALDADSVRFLTFPDLLHPPPSMFRSYIVAIVNARSVAREKLESASAQWLSLARRFLQGEMRTIIALKFRVYVLAGSDLDPESYEDLRLPRHVTGDRIWRRKGLWPLCTRLRLEFLT